MVHGFIDEKHVKRERAKAKELRRSQWWKNSLALGVCFYCESRFSPEELTMDHKVPLSRGGRSNKGNLVTSCKGCNNKKKYYTPAEMALQGLDAQSLPTEE